MLLHFEGRVARSRDDVVRLAVIGALLGATACGSGSTGPKTGKLDVTIEAPSGVTPRVTVSGPGGYSRTLSASTLLVGLASGSYTLTAATVTSTNAIVGTVYTGAVSGSPVAITPSVVDFAVTASYAQRPGTGGLWIAQGQSQPSVVQFTASQLDAVIEGKTVLGVTPSIIVGTGNQTNYVAFDANGNLWVTILMSNSVVEFAASELNGDGTPAPAIAITANAGSLNAPAGLTFDASGNLWVANAGSNTVVEFTASQLASSGSPTPAVTISASGQSLVGPSGIAFDTSGNVWVANEVVSTVVKFTPAQLAASGAPTPAVTLDPNANSISGPIMIAFDAKGDLWFANGFSNTLVAFAPRQLAASGSPTPTVTLSTNSGSLDFPFGLAFDGSGDLWVSNISGGSVVEFSAAQIAASGSPTPTATISGASVFFPSGLAFDPHPSGLPLES
jgi:sugar lactone lactonase YvrE